MFCRKWLCLSVVVILLGLGILLTLGILMNSNTSSMDSEDDTPYEITPSSPSSASLDQLAIIADLSDDRAEPCDNFYNFACGNWANVYTDDNKVSLTLNNFTKLQTLLNKDKSIAIENQNFWDKTLAVYYSCLYEEPLDFFEIIKLDENIQWPTIPELHGKNQTNLDQNDFLQLLGKLFSYGFNNFLFQHSVQRMSNGSLKMVIDVPTHVERTGQLISTVLQLLGEIATGGKLNEFYQGYLYTDYVYNYIYSEFTEKHIGVFSYEEIKKLYPKLATFLHAMLQDKLNNSDIVEITNVKYLNYWQELEWDLEETKKHYNYAMFMLVEYFSPLFEANCEELVWTCMSLAINYKMREEYYTSEVANDLSKLHSDIKNSLRDVVNRNKPQFNKIQLQAIQKALDNVYISVGNVPDSLNVDNVHEFYSNLPYIDDQNLSKNILKILKHKFLQQLNCPPYMDCSSIIEEKATDHLANKSLFVIPFAYMNPYIYDYAFDPILKVSALGSVIGRGCASVLTGEALKNPKFYETVYEEFQNDINVNISYTCTYLQFPKLSNGILQADLLGAQAAFNIYQTKYGSKQPTFTSIPWNQLFFLNYAQYFCHDSNNDFKLWRYNDRLNYVAMNMDEFAEAFNCRVGSNMNPREKCLLY